MVRPDPFIESALFPFFGQDLRGLFTGASSLPMNVVEREQEVEVTIEVPGTREENINLEVNRNVLTITVDEPLQEVEGRRLMHERAHGRRTRRLELGDKLKFDAIDASLAHGILTLVIPKEEEAKPRRIAIGKPVEALNEK